MTQTWKIFALIAAFILLQSSPLSALSSAHTLASASEVSGAQSQFAAPSAAAGGAVSADLSFELVPATLSGASKLLVQLIGGQNGTADLRGIADASLINLQSGAQTARLVFLDDKDQPVEGGVALVHFRLHATTMAAGSQAAPPRPGVVRGAAPGPPPVPPELRNEGDPDPTPPTKGSPLLLVSLIGFALLLGGIIPGMRARRVHPARTAPSAHF